MKLKTGLLALCSLIMMSSQLAFAQSNLGRFVELHCSNANEFGLSISVDSTWTGRENSYTAQAGYGFYSADLPNCSTTVDEISCAGKWDVQGSDATLRIFVDSRGLILAEILVLGRPMILSCSGKG